MAISSGRPDASLDSELERLLYEESYRFEFFEAVRLLGRLEPLRRPVGEEGPPKDEIVRFSSFVSLSFPPSQIYDLVPDKAAGRPPRMRVTFLGMIGPSGALPRYYTELALERARRKDFTLRDFLDLFNHRLISLFYRGWEKYRVMTGYERAEARSRQARQRSPAAHREFLTAERPRIDRLSQCLLDLGGLGAPALRYSAAARHEVQPRRALTDETLRFYAGLLAQRHRSALGLEGMLCDYFGVCVVVRQFHGQWLKLAAENQSCFTADGLSGNMRLGVDTVVGERVWDAQSKFRLTVGPLRYRQFQDFLPSGSAYRPLEHLTRLYAGQQFDFDVQLVLLGSEAPPCLLTVDSTRCVRLGWHTWLRSGDFDRNLDDAVFSASE